MTQSVLFPCYVLFIQEIESSIFWLQILRALVDFNGWLPMESALFHNVQAVLLLVTMDGGQPAVAFQHPRQADEQADEVGGVKGASLEYKHDHLATVFA